MKIISTLVQPVEATKERVLAVLKDRGITDTKQVQLLVFDTLVEQKNLVTGITVGQVNGQTIDDVKVSVVGQAVIECLLGHHDLNYQGKPLVVAGVQQVANAVERVSQVLSKAPDGAAVLLVCADSKVYDAAARGLGIDYQSAVQNTH